MTRALTPDTYPVAWDDPNEQDGGFTMHGRLAVRADGTLERWNGFVCPYFTRAEVERYAAWVLAQPNDELNGDPLYTWIEWDGAIMVEHDPRYEDDPDTHGIQRTDPTADGLYPLGAWSWTWAIVPPVGFHEPADMLEYGLAREAAREDGHPADAPNIVICDNCGEPADMRNPQVLAFHTAEV